MPVPEGSTGGDLARLSVMLDATGAERLVILGDVLHARAGVVDVVVDAVCGWRDRHAALALAYVPGNHDVKAGAMPVEWRMERMESGVVDGPFVLRHEPPVAGVSLDDGYVLCGHIHPMVVLRERIGPAIRCPCFVV